jgi:hypothetical protein
MGSGKHRRRRSDLTPRVTIGQVKYHLQYAITSGLFCSHCERSVRGDTRYRLSTGGATKVYAHRAIEPGEGVTAQQ